MTKNCRVYVLSGRHFLRSPALSWWLRKTINCLLVVIQLGIIAPMWTTGDSTGENCSREQLAILVAHFHDLHLVCSSPLVMRKGSWCLFSPQRSWRSELPGCLRHLTSVPIATLYFHHAASHSSLRQVKAKRKKTDRGISKFLHTRALRSCFQSSKV